MGYGNSKEFYARNPEKYEARKKQITKRKNEGVEKVREYRKTQVCLQCGFSDWRAIDFHHREPSDKEITIAEMVTRGWSWTRMLIELEKCDPLCRNCHAILHAEEREQISV